LSAYEQSVRGHKDGLKSGKTLKKKAKQSTFYPDKVGEQKTTETDLKNAVETAGDRSDKKVQTPEAWRGMELKSIGATVYPTGGTDRDAE
jgi:hypothetical protein